jgi:hypothetical protein
MVADFEASRHAACSVWLEEMSRMHVFVTNKKKIEEKAERCATVAGGKMVRSQVEPLGSVNAGEETAQRSRNKRRWRCSESGGQRVGTPAEGEERKN